MGRLGPSLDGVRREGRAQRRWRVAVWRAGGAVGLWGPFPPGKTVFFLNCTAVECNELDGLSAAHLKIPPYSACCTDATKLADASKLQSGYFLLYFL